jgi:hypothetical protein
MGLSERRQYVRGAGLCDLPRRREAEDHGELEQIPGWSAGGYRQVPTVFSVNSGWSERVRQSAKLFRPGHFALNNVRIPALPS